MLLLDRGCNDHWVKPHRLVSAGKSRWSVKLVEPLGWTWINEIVTYELPAPAARAKLRATLAGVEIPSQRTIDGKSIAILVPRLESGQALDLVLETGKSAIPPTTAVTVRPEDGSLIASTGKLSVRLPASAALGPADSIPGPILCVRREGGEWFGRGRIESPVRAKSIRTKVVEQGPIWTGVEVVYSFDKSASYRVVVRLRPNEEYVEVEEDSSLPVNLWPAPRPYREIGSLGASWWSQPLDAIAKPCIRPCPTCNFLFEFTPAFEPDRLLAHATAAIQMMDMPLRWGPVRTYTAMRPCYVGVDAGWLGVYRGDRDELFGVASLDIVNWRLPDDYNHPAHRLAGANAEVLLVDSRDAGSYFKFPIEQVSRMWFLGGYSRAAIPGLGETLKPAGTPVPLDAQPNMPLWSLRTRRGDLRLDKVKDWITDWPDKGDEHPRVLCGPGDFARIRKNIGNIPELSENYEATKQWRPADRYIVTGEPGSQTPGQGTLDEVEAQTKAAHLVNTVLERGFASMPYAIGLTRPLRRYITGVDVLWPVLTPQERRTARRVIALAAYFMTDGDWWSYPWRDDETTYLANFNSDVFTCAGTAGIFLSDHPCSKLWIRHMIKRLDMEFKDHVRLDGGGEENVGCYLVSTWSQLLLPAVWALKRNRIKDYSNNKYLLAGFRFLVKAMSSPDPRASWQRMMPPIGHHPHAKMQLPSMAWFAAFVKESDPKLASNLMWAWREMGSRVRNFYDHQGPPASPLTRHYIMHDPAIKAAAPDPELHTSMEFPRIGSLFRTHGLTREGSYVFLKAGREHSHHDDDEGSFHYFGRGIPLACDGLRLENGAPVHEHNVVSFPRPGQPTANIVCFKSTPVADYVRAVATPRGHCTDTNYVDGTHRSGFERQLLLVKSDKPGGVEYLIVKDVVAGPDPVQWNLDVLSREPIVRGKGQLWYPGHEEFGMGMDLFLLEPSEPKLQIEKGKVNAEITDPEKRARLANYFADYAVNEHWLLHVPENPGATFVAVLFPRRADEQEPKVEYLEREETIRVTHAEGRDLIFLRPTAGTDVIIEDTDFRGRAGIVRHRKGKRVMQPLDAVDMRQVVGPSCNLVEID